MPKKPKRPCSYPGCPKLTDGRFCEEHQRQENKRYEKYDHRGIKRECCRFFRSDWFKTLTAIDGEMLISRLKSEVQ